MVFMDPSLRTRSSMETAMFLHGGHALALEPGKGSWALETELDVVMDGTTVEHIIEAARVLSRYADALAVRSFPKGNDWATERLDPTIRNFARFAEKPVINLESARRHPCQGLADAMTMREHLGETVGQALRADVGLASEGVADRGAGERGDRRRAPRDGGDDRTPRRATISIPDDYVAIETLAGGRAVARCRSPTSSTARSRAPTWSTRSRGDRWRTSAIPTTERAGREGKRDWRLTQARMRATAAREGHRDALPAGAPQRRDGRRGARRAEQCRDRPGGEPAACAAGVVAGIDGSLVVSRKSLVV